MKRLTITLLFLFISITEAQISINEQIIAPGVIHKKIINSLDTLSIDVLKIELSKGNYLLKSIKAKNTLNEKETTSDLAKALTDSGYDVVAAINADFFEKDGEIINTMISEGKFVKAVKFTDSPYNSFVNSQFAVTYKNHLALEQFVFSWKRDFF